MLAVGMFWLIGIVILGGLVVWAVYTYLPIPNGFKILIYCIVIFCLVIYILDALGVLVNDPQVPHIQRY